MSKPSTNGIGRWPRLGLSLGLLGVVAGGPAATAATAEELSRQLEELKAKVQQLEQQLQTVDPAEVATRNDIDGLRSDLENYKYEDKRNRDTKSPVSTRGLTIGGTVQARGGVQSAPTKAGSTATAAERHSSFDIPQATLTFAGSLYKDYAEGRNLDFRLAFGYVKNSPANNNSNFNVTDAFLRYSPFPTATGLEEPRLTLTFGQQQIPFGLEAQVGEELRPVINSAQFLSATGVGTRQIGLVVRGDLLPYVDYGFNYRAPLLDYAVGLVNGSGPNKSDDNNHKDLLGRVAFTLPVDYNSVFRELRLGASYYRGKKNLTRTVAGVASTVGQGKSDRLGFDIYYNHDPFGVTYEYIQGKDAVLNGPEAESRGQYLTLFYTWGEQWVKAFRGQAKYDDWWPKSYQPFLRWDEYDPNTNGDGDKSTVWTAGFNLFFAETTKFQINVNRYDNQNAATPDYNELLVQFQYGF